MEQRKNPLMHEPGRRYITSRVRPRMHPQRGTGIPRQPVVSQPINKPNQSSQKQIDFAPANSKPTTKRPVSAAKPALPRPHRSLVLRRHMVERAGEHRKEVRRSYKKHFVGFIGGAIVVVAFAIVSWSFWDFLPVLRSISVPFISSNHQNQQPETPNIRSASSLDENKPSLADIRNYQSAMDAPRVLRIPKLTIEARVKRVGASLTGEPISPNNIFDVGWFDDSGKPGQPGAVLINGHVSGKTKPGVFSTINTLAAGDELFLERGDNTIIKYVVVRVQVYSGDQMDMGMAIQPVQVDKNGLNLMTSVANYDASYNRSEQRVIVFAVQQ